MKRFTLFCLFTFFAIPYIFAFPSRDSTANSVYSFVHNGKIIDAERLIVGEVSLYRYTYIAEGLHMSGGMVMDQTDETRFRYFLGLNQGKVVEIHTANYKQLIRKYLKNAPELHRKLGRFGFRFENVPSMLIYYNRFKAEQTVNTVYNLRQMTLSMQK